MKKHFFCFRIIMILLAVYAHAIKSSTPEIVRLDARIDAIVPRDARLEKLADGFSWAEGPVWIRNGSVSSFFRCSEQSGFEMEGWKPGFDFLKEQRLFGNSLLHRKRTWFQWFNHRSTGASRFLPARGS